MHHVFIKLLQNFLIIQDATWIIEKWGTRQFIYQAKKEKSFECPKIIVWKANAVHQADLCQMPMDPLSFFYFLTVIDVATRKLDAEPLKTKTAFEVLNAFKRIYSRNYLCHPTVRLEVDSGSEFKSVVLDYFVNILHVVVKVGQPGRHR